METWYSIVVVSRIWPSPSCTWILKSKKMKKKYHVIILVLVLYTSTVQDLCAWKSENITRNSQKKICMALNPTPRINKIASSFMLLHNSWQHCTYQSNRARVFSIYLRLQKYISSHFVFFFRWLVNPQINGRWLQWYSVLMLMLVSRHKFI